jgi:hypothetical protein
VRSVFAGCHSPVALIAIQAVAGVVAFVAFFAVIQPALSGSHPWFALQYFSAIHRTARGWHAIAGRVNYLVEALLPLLFLPLRSPWVLLALPSFVEVLSSRWSITYTMGQHYAGEWIGYVLAAFVMSLSAIAQKSPSRARAAAGWSIAICLLINVADSPAHWGHFLGARTAHDAVLDRALAEIPVGAPAGSVDEIFVHMSLNPNARSGYNGPVDYLVADSHYDSEGWRDHYRRLQRQLSSGRFGIASSDDGVTLYRRRVAAGTAP